MKHLTFPVFWWACGLCMSKVCRYCDDCACPVSINRKTCTNKAFLAGSWKLEPSLYLTFKRNNSILQDPYLTKRFDFGSKSKPSFLTFACHTTPWKLHRCNGRQDPFHGRVAILLHEDGSQYNWWIAPCNFKVNRKLCNLSVHRMLPWATHGDLQKPWFFSCQGAKEVIKTSRGKAQTSSWWSE